MAPTIERKLRIQFQKEIQHGFAKNACLDPRLSSAAEQAAEPNERFIVWVDPKQGGHYWFTDRRVLREDASGTRELVRYQSIQRTHWMFKDSWKDPRLLSQAASLKSKYYDRLEIETKDGLLVMEGLDQAYMPTLNFFQWIVD